MLDQTCKKMKNDLIIALTVEVRSRDIAAVVIITRLVL